MKKPVDRRLPHNWTTKKLEDGSIVPFTHKEMMANRKAARNARRVTYRKLKTGKYSPMVEDMKHRQQRENQDEPT